MTSVSRYTRDLKEKKMITGEKDNAGKYHIKFTNNFLIGSVIKKPEEEGFIPVKINE